VASRIVPPSTRVRSFLTLLSHGRDGNALVEFALLAPAFVLMVIGIVELSLLFLGEVLLQGAVADASRFGLTGRSLDGRTREEAIRQIVDEGTFGLIDTAQLRLDTLVYPSFDSIGKPEGFTDQNGNGTWDSGEPFTDVNGNGTWDADIGAAGLGGPSDVVLYRVTAPWQMLTPLIRGIVPADGMLELEASLAIRNEPFPVAGG
jgi:Flp pilus assembly protein TadG